MRSRVGAPFGHAMEAGFSRRLFSGAGQSGRQGAHRFQIIKVVSGDDEQTLAKVADLYGSIITAGVHKASSIKVAEAAKVIENTQRDLNIALMNELALIFDRIGIDTLEVLQAAGTKWNFLPFRPGLVGGHCIGVDPYYLTHKAEMIGYHPQVILAGRRINDGMGAYVAQQTLKQLIKNGSPLPGAKVIVLGTHVQGELSGPAQLQSRRCDSRVEGARLRGQRSRSDCGLPRCRSTTTAWRLTPWEELPAKPMPSSQLFLTEVTLRCLFARSCRG